MYICIYRSGSNGEGECSRHAETCGGGQAVMLSTDVCYAYADVCYAYADVCYAYADACYAERMQMHREAIAAGSPSKLVVLKCYKIQISGTEVLHNFRGAASGDLGGDKALGCPPFFPGNGRGQS